MMVNITQIDWNDVNKAVPAFITISIMVRSDPSTRLEAPSNPSRGHISPWIENLLPMWMLRTYAAVHTVICH